MARIHIWGGGPYHPTRDQAEVLRERLHPLGHQIIYGESRVMFERDQLADADLLIMSGLDWTGIATCSPRAWADPSLQPPMYEPLDDRFVQSITDYLAAGKPLLCHHGAIASFDERPEFEEFFDGRWIWNRSTHSPYQDFRVTITNPAHPVTADMEDFQITDELYYNLNYPKRSEILLEAAYDGRSWPLAWAGTYCSARTAYSGLGHNMQTYANPHLQQFLTNLVQWLLQK